MSQSESRVRVRCECGKAYRVLVERLGRNKRCKECDAVFVMHPAERKSAAKTKPKPQGAKPKEQKAKPEATDHPERKAVGGAPRRMRLLVVGAGALLLAGGAGFLVLVGGEPPASTSPQTQAPTGQQTQSAATPQSAAVAEAQTEPKVAKSFVDRLSPIRGGSSRQPRVAVAPEGGVFFLGTSDVNPQPQLVFAPGTPEETPGPSGPEPALALTLARYAPDGKLTGVTVVEGASTGAGAGIAPLGGGRVVIGGDVDNRFNHRRVSFGPELVVETAEQGERFGDLFLARVDADGSFAWVRQLGGMPSSNQALFGLLPLGDGFLCAGTASQLNVGCKDTVTLEGAGSDPGFVASYDADGGLCWVTPLQSASGWTSSGQRLRLLAGPNDTCYLVGGIDTQIVLGDLNAGGLSLEREGEYPAAFLAQLDADGTPVWGKILEGRGELIGLVRVNAAVGSEHGVALSGQVAGSLVLDGQEALPAGPSKWFLLNCDPQGNVRYARAEIPAEQLVALPDGDLLAFGETRKSPRGAQPPAWYRLQPGEYTTAFALRLDPSGGERWAERFASVKGGGASSCFEWLGAGVDAEGYVHLGLGAPVPPLSLAPDAPGPQLKGGHVGLLRLRLP